MDLDQFGTVLARTGAETFFVFDVITGGEPIMLKKYFTTLLMISMMGVMLPLMATNASAAAAATSASGPSRCYNARTRTYYLCKKPNFYRRHRKAINIAAGTGIGMLVGGLLGGRKGVVIGGLAGAGGGALFTHKQRPKNYIRPYYRRY